MISDRRAQFRTTDTSELQKPKEKRETLLLKRFLALLDTRAPTQPCSEDTELMELPQRNIHTCSRTQAQGHKAEVLLPTGLRGGCSFTHIPQALALTFPVGLQHQVSTF